jgi:DNA-binding NtrC family response regulator
MTEPAHTKLLILDDEEDMLKLLKRTLSRDLDCEVFAAPDAVKALAHMEETRFDVVLADVRMPGMNGMEFLQRAKSEYPDLTVVMMTAYGSIDMAVQAIKSGAYEFITKPFEHDKLVHVLAKALERTRLVRENLVLQKRIREQETFHEMVGASPEMRRVIEVVQLMAQVDTTVLITGESGTGKDVAAKTIHRLSPRNRGPYVAVNCPNLPENILESELFGFKKGAFTHATHDKRGLFWEAQGGTIYLDEIGDISPTLQTKLLRVIQEKEIRPLGQNKSVKVDVRIVASTNRDLEAKIKDNSFREDLFYRLNVLSLHMPPLRDRPEDVPLLVDHFLTQFCREFNKGPKTVSTELMRHLASHTWRGNVRELQNAISRAVLLSPGNVITPEDLDWEPRGIEKCAIAITASNLPYKEAKALVLEQFNREYISEVLVRNSNNVTRAAKDSGLERQALQQIMRRYGIKSRGVQSEDSPSE